MKKNIYPFIFLLLIFCACNDYEELLYAEDQLVAISQVDLDFSFQDLSTFSVNDTIYEVFIDAKGKETTNKILATYQKDLIVQQMENRGFSYIPFSELSSERLPDLFFDLTYVENKFVQVGIGWWYDYYDPYWFSYWDWGPYYPYYPLSYTTVSSYTAKSFIMDCLFMEQNSDHKYNAKSCFIGLVRGIAEKYKEQDISTYINQCFDQTPEIDKNKRYYY